MFSLILALNELALKAVSCKKTKNTRNFGLVCLSWTFDVVRYIIKRLKLLKAKRNHVSSCNKQIYQMRSLYYRRNILAIITSHSIFKLRNLKQYERPRFFVVFFSYYCCFVIYVQIAYEYGRRGFRVVHYNVAHLRNLRLQAMTNFNWIFLSYSS